MTLPDALAAALADHYTLERELGHGGMATVYLARDVRHDRRVAVKVLRPELAAVIGAERFALEIRTTANLQHPHILPLHDSGEVNGTVFYVMPFIEGETLRDRLARESQLPVNEAITLITQVASALDYAHRQGVVHRDIKPENILLHDGQALVADFGIALAASKSDNASRLTETGMSLGTPSYMSPEQAMGQRDISARADVYALGCVLYEMLVGEPPFSGANAQAIVAKILTEPAPSIVRQRPRVPEAIDHAVQRALEKLPADRFATAKEFAEALDLRATGAQRSTSAAPASAPQPARTSRTLLTIAAVAIATAVLGYFVGARGNNGANNTEWEGQLISGPAVAFEPRLSPDGSMMAFAAMVNGLTQLGLRRVDSDDWTVLTSDRTRGVVTWISWARDNSRIYFARLFGVPRGIWSISPLGRDEKLVLEDAGSPEPLPDGTLIVARMQAGRLRAYHFFPETGRLDSLNASMDLPFSETTIMRAVPDGRRIVYFGRPASDSTAARALYVLDIATGRNVLLSPLVTGRASLQAPAFAVSADGQYVVCQTMAGELVRLVSIPIDGSKSPRILSTLPPTSTNGMDVGADGSIYFADRSRPAEIRWYQDHGNAFESTPIEDGDKMLLELTDGRMISAMSVVGRSRIMVRSRDGQAVPFVQTKEVTGLPFSLLGPDRVAVTIGENRDRSIGIVDARSGQLTARLRGISPQMLAGSPDGATIYYTVDGVVWAVNAQRDLSDQSDASKSAKRVTSGSSVAVDPHGKYLVVSRATVDGARLVRIELPSYTETPIKLNGEFRISPQSGLLSNAIGADGRIVVALISPASWFWSIAVVDPVRGTYETIKPSEGHDGWGGWTSDGRILASSTDIGGRIWRMKPVTAKP